MGMPEENHVRALLRRGGLKQSRSALHAVPRAVREKQGMPFKAQKLFLGSVLPLRHGKIAVSAHTEQRRWGEHGAIQLPQTVAEKDHAVGLARLSCQCGADAAVASVCVRKDQKFHHSAPFSFSSAAKIRLISSRPPTCISCPLTAAAPRIPCTYHAICLRDSAIPIFSPCSRTIASACR